MKMIGNIKENNMKTIDIHALQNIPPSCLNRDSTNAPKTCQYGGVRRMRVSSQSWKKAMRDYAVEHFNADDYGVRTKNVVDVIANEILKLDEWHGTKKDAAKLVRKAIVDSGAGLDFEKKNKGVESDKLSALFFLGHEQARRFAVDTIKPDDDFDEEHTRAKALYHDLNGGNSIDVASFGRMLASKPDLNVEAAMSVQHAIGVSPVQVEYDYYTAVDDHSLEDHAGSAMMGDIQFDSGVVYRYANINIPTLEDNLDHNEVMVRKAIREMIDAFIYSIPSGKQHSFAGETLPDTIIVEVHDGRQRSLVGAFEEPVENEHGILSDARVKLKDYLESIDGIYGFNGTRYALTMGDVEFQNCSQTSNVNDLEDKVVSKTMGDYSE